MAQDEIRLLLDQELAGETPPPLGYLVDASMRQGRRMRRTRLAWTAGGGAAVAALALGALIVGTTSLPVPGLAAGGQQAAAGGTSASVAAAATTTVKATPQGMLELLSHLLPPGQRSQPAVVTGGGLMAAMNLDRGQGVGMVRVSVDSATGPPMARPDGCPKTWTCRTLPDGNVAMIASLPDNCIQHQYVFVRRPDHTGVEVTAASCLSWNGRTNPPGKVVLSVDEAIAIGDNPQWGLQMSKDLVDAGQRDFPHPATFG